MGNQPSNSGDNKTKDNINVANSEASYYYVDNCSSYKGMKTDTTGGAKSNSCSHTSDKATDQETASITEKRVPVKFEWKEGGNKVLITGSFLNWNTFIEMSKNLSTGIFEFNINLPKGVYQFKFIIDGVWRFTNAYPTVKDNNGNTNNVIDITNYVEPQEKKTEDKNGNNSKESSKKDNSENYYLKKKNDYNSYYPKKSEMNTDAPHVPYHYLKNFNINYNTRQNKIGIKKFLIYNEKNLLSENNSYKKILICPHVNL